MGKLMLNGVDYSAPSFSGVSGVKGNKETSYRQGQVNLTPANLGAATETSVNNIVSGTTQVGDAKKFDGQASTYYAKASDLVNYLPLIGGGKVYKSNGVPLIVEGDTMGFVESRANDRTLGYLGFDAENRPRFMNRDFASYDLLHTGNMASHVLPLTGGLIGNGMSNDTPLGIKGGTHALINYYDKDGTMLGMLGFSPSKSPTFYTEDWVGYSFLHTGNSAKVSIQSTAPTDGLWVDTATKKVKALIDGAWTAMA